jgi:hypothetical protein
MGRPQVALIVYILGNQIVPMNIQASRFMWSEKIKMHNNVTNHKA